MTTQKATIVTRHVIPYTMNVPAFDASVICVTLCTWDGCTP